MSKQTPLERAIAAAGGPPRLAEALGITPEAIYQWDVLPVARVLEVEKLTGVPRHELRPDYYPPPDKDAAA